MEVKVRLDPKVVWKLNDLAERQGVKVGRVVEQLLDGLTVAAQSGPKGRVSSEQREATRQRVRELHAEGLTDVEIGARIDRVPAHVGRVRRELGLKSNKRK